VIVSRAEVLFPSETSTLSGFGTGEDSVIPDHSRSPGLCLANSVTQLAIPGTVAGGSHAALFMDK
jgi:hypothetical protein